MAFKETPTVESNIVNNNLLAAIIFYFVRQSREECHFVSVAYEHMWKHIKRKDNRENTTMLHKIW